MAAAEALEAHKNAVTLRLEKIRSTSKSIVTKRESISKREITELVRPNILELTAYSSARSEFKGSAEVFLDANENPFENGMNRYPDPLQRELKREIGKWRNISPKNIFLGNGSDEIIGLLMQTFCRPQRDGVIILPPTFGVYQVAAGIGEINVKRINLDDNFQPQVNVILKSAAANDKILFLCSPNNPTGNSFDFEKIEKLIREFDGIVVVDEAYIDFSKNPTCVDLLEKYPNLIVLQTFSKALGMAGARLGIAFAAEEIIGYLNKVKMPYNINELTQRAALQALAKKEIFDQQIQTILHQRNLLESELQKFACIQKIYPSDANFLLVKTAHPDQLYQFLVSRKIIVRNRSKQVGCAGCLRLTVGLEEENYRLIESLKIYEEQNLVTKNKTKKNEKSTFSR
ncbi:MAG: histidinol-phosphate transaminase [Bacteroidota bacterium]